jgi:hypothetical protein
MYAPQCAYIGRLSYITAKKQPEEDETEIVAIHDPSDNEPAEKLPEGFGGGKTRAEVIPLPNETRVHFSFC